MARRGRPRKTKPRKPCGRLRQPAQPVDYGPEEIQARRVGLHGETDSPLARLVRMGIITDAQAEAGEMFERSRRRLWGAGAAPAARYQEYIPGEPEEPRDQVRLFSEWQAAYSAIMSLGPDHGMRASSIIRVVFQEWQEPPMSRVDDLRRGLDALIDHYHLRRAA